MKILFPLTMAIILSAKTVYGQAHGHLNIGAVSTNFGAQLTFDNASIFTTNTGFIQTLVFTNASTYAGYYQGNITLTALAETAANSGPVPGAPAFGSLIYAQIVSVEGPTGGVFGFWDTGATNPTISVPCGSTGTNSYKVTQSNGEPDSDPFGHIHGRKFTATKPGIYLVGFRALDFSTNGIGGGPIHTPSEVLKFYFQAGVNIASIVKADDATTITFGAPGGRNCSLEYLSSLSSTNWTTVDGPITGNDALQTLTDPTPLDAVRFYRIKTQ